MGSHTIEQILESQHAIFAILVEHRTDDIVRHISSCIHFKQTLEFTQFRNQDFRLYLFILYRLIQFFYHPVDIRLCSETTLLRWIGMPFHIRFIDRTNVVYLISLFAEMFGTIYEEAGKVVELILLQVDVITVSRYGSPASSHEIRC